MKIIQIICLLFAVLSAGAYRLQAQGSDEVRQDWDALCATIDCTEVPFGYKTVELDQMRYYFPFRSRLNVAESSGHVPYFVRPARHAEYSDEGVYLRSFERDISRIRVTACCSLLLAHFDLTKGWPNLGRARYQSSTKGNTPDGVDFSLFSRLEAGRDHNANWHFDGKREQVSVRFLEERLQSGEYQDLGDHFVLLRTSDAYEAGTFGARRPIWFVSKERILNGRYVFGQCNANCYFHTLRFADDPVDALPNVHLGNIWLRLYKPQICEDPHPVQNCDKGVEVFDELPTLFKKFEGLFTALKTPPTMME